MIINLLATWIPALLIALLGVLKLSGNPKIAEEISKLGVGRYLRLLGVMEIAFAVLFVVPATMKLGFIFASCYFGGAIATELSHDALQANPFIPIALLWIGALHEVPPSMPGEAFKHRMPLVKEELATEL